jgi:hypothetical protein
MTVHTIYFILFYFLGV